MMELLKRWLDGSINWKEEKQLRNQAQDDLFLADALEGLDALPAIDHAQGINRLDQRLQERIKKKKNKQTIYPIRAIAAALLLLLSAGIWWNLQSSLNQSTIAEKKVQSTPAPASPIMKNEAADFLADESTAASSTSIENIAKDDPPSKQEVLLSKELAVVQKELPTTSIPSNTQKVLADDPVQEVFTKRLSAPSIVRETVSTEDSQDKESVREASVIVMEETNSEAPPIEAEQVEETADAILFSYEESIAASPAPAAMVEESTLMSPQPTDEGVISAVAEPEANTSRSAKRKISDTSKVVPVGGMEAFKEYIKINTVYPEEAKAENIQGTVFLVFTLDTDGAIQNVEVTKSLHPACDLEAIRLLREGPKWISPVNVGYCKISFGLED